MSCNSNIFGDMMGEFNEEVPLEDKCKDAFVTHQNFWAAKWGKSCMNEKYRFVPITDYA